MKRKLILFLATITITSILFSGCRNKETETTTVVSESVEEVELTEHEEIELVEEENLDEINEEASYSADIIVEGEIVQGTALTQAEIDELKATAPTDFAKENVEIYESIAKNGGWDDGYGNVYTRVVGKPDASWRRMTDEEAEAILAKGEEAEGYYEAEVELEDKEFYGLDYAHKTVYFDYYAYVEDVLKPAFEARKAEVLRDCEESLKKILEDPEHYIRLCESFGPTLLPKWAVEQLEIWDSFSDELKETIYLVD